MKNREGFVIEYVVFVLLFVLLVAIIGGIVCMSRTGNYQYVDMDGNTGHSNHCYTSYGAMYCLVDGGRVMVKQYQEDK